MILYTCMVYKYIISYCSSAGGHGGRTEICSLYCCGFSTLNLRHLIANHCLQDIDVANQEAVDKLMLALDGTENKCKSLVLYCVRASF